MTLEDLRKMGDHQSLIIVAEEIEGQALAAMIMNAMRGTLKIAGVKAPYYGEERRFALDDLALSTGALFVSRSNGMKLKDIKLKDLGTAKFIECTKKTTTIVGGNADHEEIENRIERLRSSIKNTDNLDEAEAYQNRITRLASGVAVIRVGGTTDVEVTEKKHRIEDALEAVRSAQDQGIVPGGGVALLRAAQSMVIVTKDAHAEQGSGMLVIKQACEAPIRQMALNSGASPDLIVDKVLEGDDDLGWDFRAQELVDMPKSGIIDPVKVTITALQNAASCAGTLITTNFGIIQTESD